MDPRELPGRLVETGATLLISVLLFGWLLYDYLPTTETPGWASAVLLSIIPISDLIVLAGIWRN